MAANLAHQLVQAAGADRCGSSWIGRTSAVRRCVERQRITVFLAQSGGGGTYHNTKPVQVSRPFASALIASAKEGRTPFTTAFRLLDVEKESTFDGLAERIGVQ